ncbi:MAG: ATP-binding protein [bacterium]
MIEELVARIVSGDIGSERLLVIAIGLVCGLAGAVVALIRKAASARENIRIETERARESEQRERQKCENLARILEISNRINATLDLGSLLDAIVHAVSESLGFRMALLRMYDEQSGTFVAKAFAGLNEEAIHKLSSRSVSLETFKSWMRDEFRMSKSYFISHKVGFWKDRENEIYIPDLGDRSDDEWHPMDTLFVPLWGRDRRLIGYLSVDDPVDRKIPTMEMIETLEIFANQAVTAIENARLYADLEDHIAKLRQMTKKLRELNQMKSNFVATVSHELKTPLTSIMAYAETLSRDWKETPRQIQMEFLKIIDEEAKRLTSIVENMLDLSKLESGRVEIKRCDTDLTNLFVEIKNLLSPAVQKKHISLDIALPENKIVAFVDGNMIKQVVINLVGNAIKFTPEGGRVTVRVKDMGTTVEFSVEDTGIGIPPESIDRIFEEFYQVDSSDTRRFGGVGLGLAIVKRIVEWHDGRIWVESEAGVGTKFTVCLPKHKAVTVIPSHDDAESEDVRKRKPVEELIVDMIAEMMGARTASLMLLDQESNELYVSAAMGLDESIVRSARVKVGCGISGWVAETGKPLLIYDIDSDQRFAPSRRPQYETNSLVSVPLKKGDEVIGVINVTNKITLTPFTKSDADLLQILADRISNVLQRAKHFENLKGEYETMVNSLMCLIESKRLVYTRKEVNVSELVVELGRAMGLCEGDVRMLQYVSQIYDVGMVGIGEGVLGRRGALRVGEYASVKRHPEVGVGIVEPIEFMEQVKEVMLRHHERYDGSGYPGGLRGEEIPIGARILAVVDAYSSMVSERPYRRAMSEVEAIEELRRCSGTQFDPIVVEKFIEILDGRHRDKMLKPEEGGKVDVAWQSSGCR